MTNSLNNIPNNFTFVIHAGAGAISQEINATQYLDALRQVVESTYRFVKSNTNKSTGLHNIHALDIVEYAVRLMEDIPLFNAGKGAVYTNKKTHELEACIMDGRTGTAGACSLVNRVKNPISLARVVMEKTKHVYIVGDAANDLAALHNLDLVEPDYYSTQYRLEQLQRAQTTAGVFLDHDLPRQQQSITQPVAGETGTVGCVAMLDGHVAAATSTGGMTNKMKGRIGDSPIVGAGTYANDQTCAVSCTGKGELFLLNTAAYDISARMLYAGKSLPDAVSEMISHKLPQGSGGVISVNKSGQYSMQFNSLGMFRAACTSDGKDGKVEAGIWTESVHYSLDDDWIHFDDHHR